MSLSRYIYEQAQKLIQVMQDFDQLHRVLNRARNESNQEQNTDIGHG
jgi:hypothetical protein